MIHMENSPIWRFLLEASDIQGRMVFVMANPFSLAGETALITGGGSGLGFGIAESFVQAGARVVLVGRRAGILEEAVKKLGASAAFEAHDITDLDQADALIERVTKRVGTISILVNNAGIHLKKPAIEPTPARFNRGSQTPRGPPVRLPRPVLPDMGQPRHGNILFTAS